MKHTVTVISTVGTNEKLPSLHTEVLAEHNANLLDLLIANGFLLPAACGGKGTCGKCSVTVVKGTVGGVTPDRDNKVLSCRARIVGDVTVALTEQRQTTVSHKKNTAVGSALGVALDIGTTTLAATLVDLSTKETVAKYTALNPQGVCGADVLSRIEAFGNGKGELLQHLILDGTRTALRALAKDAPVKELTVAANPTMLHLFLGIDPTSIGKYPFTPAFKDTQRRTGEELSLPVERVTLLPFADAYIGSDVTAGVLLKGMHTNPRTTLLIDVGTNGEIVLSHKGKLYAASTAAGPALEGASIECGVGGIPGAICKVEVANGALSFETIDKEAPCGLCGSGLIDLIALLVREGMIDECGAMESSASSPLAPYQTEDRFSLTEKIYLSQADVRQFQLAKSAIAAGVKTLLCEHALTPQDVDAVYLAGGLGYYMNIENALAIGLLPPFPRERIHAIGNSALDGATLCLNAPERIGKLAALSADVQILELSFSETFRNEYIENMMFP